MHIVATRRYPGWILARRWLRRGRVVKVIAVCIAGCLLSAAKNFAFHGFLAEVSQSQEASQPTSHLVARTLPSVTVTTEAPIPESGPSSFREDGNGMPRLPEPVGNFTHRKIAKNNVLPIPNVLFLGVQKSGSSSLADWLYKSGMCQARAFKNEPNFYRKEVHFFDMTARYEGGIEFYAKRFRHCSIKNSGPAKFIMDATPTYFVHSRRVHELYSSDARAQDAYSSLKMIVTLREPVSRELSRYNHMVSKMKKNSKTNAWYSEVAYVNNGTIMTFDEYSQNVLRDQLSSEPSDGKKMAGHYVDHLKEWSKLFGRDRILVLSYDELKENPDKIKWRIETFLGTKFPGEMSSKNVKEIADKVRTVSPFSRKLLEPVLRKKNQELYEFFESHRGPSMEMYPFPHFHS